MKRKAIITVSAKTRYAGGKEEKLLYTVSGTMEDTASGWRLAYAEPEESGMVGSATMLDVSARRVELTRTGTVHSYLIFSEGEEFSSAYETPYGKFQTRVHTGSLRTRMNVHGGLLNLRYDLELGGAESAHELSVRIKTEDER